MKPRISVTIEHQIGSPEITMTFDCGHPDAAAALAQEWIELREKGVTFDVRIHNDPEDAAVLQ